MSSTRAEAPRLLRAGFPTRADVVREVLKVVEKVVEHDVSVLIVGESGVGKDHLAGAIHRAGPRRQNPFVKIDCPSLPSELFESELFGYEKGAFTDAHSRKKGRLDTAQKGTVYFDEIAELPLSIQAKLLRVLEERTFTRLGGNVALDLDARVISSSSIALENLRTPETLRSDLYYRINALTVVLPPLRARREDIPLLAELFLHETGQALGKQLEGFDREAMDLLSAHSWPGNVRELRNVTERAALLASAEMVTVDELPADVFLKPKHLIRSGTSASWTLEQLESHYIRAVLAATGYNYSESAKILGINRKTLLEKRRRYGIES